MPTTKISILGCGWLGLELGAQLARNGFTVKGSTTRNPKKAELAIQGIIPFQVFAGPSLEGEHLDRFLDCDIMIVTVPPSSREGIGDWPLLVHQGIASKLAKSNVKEVVLISSTSVYPQEGGTMKEEDAKRIPSLHSGVIMLDLENAFVQRKEFRTTVLRLAGLVGGERHPAKFLRGSGIMKNPDSPVNMIHRTDVIGIVQKVIDQKKFGATLNVCTPEHPKRKDFYNTAAKSYGVDEPLWDKSSGSDRIVNIQALISTLNYDFKYPNPLTWWKAWEKMHV
jgi:nucleoside-diphosphate-sugar epimerase